MKKIFIVGFPRSGTTLVHGILACSTEVLTFPETHFFSNCLEGGVIRHLIRCNSNFQRDLLSKIFSSYGELDLWNSIYPGLPQSPALLFDVSITRLASEHNKSCWVEKTPRHLYVIPKISRFIHDANFVHVLREPIASVNSLYNASINNPKIWNGITSIDKGIKRWNKDISLSLKYAKHPNHYFVNYDQLVENPNAEARLLCDFCDIKFDESMLNPRNSYSRIVEPWEEWKANNSSSIISKSNSNSGTNDSSLNNYIISKSLSWENVIKSIK